MADNFELLSYLVQYYDELSPREFYRLVFPEGALMTKEDSNLPYEDLRGKYIAIALELLPSKKDNKREVVRHLITDELDNIDSIVSKNNFTIISPISYAGIRRKSSNARFIYGITIDLDGIKSEKNIIDMFHQMDIKRIPRATSVVWSGSGLHIYYIFETPYPCFENYISVLSEVKGYLTKLIYHGYITELHDNPQMQGLFQGFRMVGSVTKSMESKARAFLTGSKVDLEYLINIVESNGYKIENKKNTIPLDKAKELYPEWYQRRIIEKKPKRKNKFEKTWTCKEALYNWWLNKIKNEATVGHRYFAIMCLAIYAKKSGVSREKLEEDAFNLVAQLDSLTVDESNHFTEDDVLYALEAYNDNYITFPIDTIVKLTQIPIEKNKRNGRKQEEHLKRIRALVEVDYPDGSWRNKNGRPTKKRDVIEWRKNNPNGSKSQCKKETGMAWDTIRKYWDDIDDEE